MGDTSFFYSMRPAYPWSEYPVGLPALAVVAAVLVVVTVWSYLGHPAATGRRVAVILALRLLALAVALVTAVRPSVGLQEEPKEPSTLLVGVDLSESMTVKDEFNNQSRVEAVRRTLDRCQPILDELKAEQNVTVVAYKFSTPDFSEAASRYDPAAPADGKRTDIGTYLNRTHDRWQGERFLRGHILISDGVDNGSTFSAVAEAGRWRPLCPLHTFAVGSNLTQPDARDVVIAELSSDPSVPVKNDVTFRALVHAYGFSGARVTAKLFFDDKEVAVEEVVLAKEKDNEVQITVKAPAAPGEVRVRLELPTLPGELSPLNNTSETYLTVTKEGVRVLVVDRLRWERTRLLDALRPELVTIDGKQVEKRRFDVVQVARQTDGPPTPGESEALDLDAQAYDVVVIGNVTARSLQAVHPRFLESLADRVLKRGMGLMFTGGEAAFGGTPDVPGTGDWKNAPLANILPVTFDAGGITEAPRGRVGFQTVPTRKGLDLFAMRVGKTDAESVALWDQLNAFVRGQSARLSGFNQFKAKNTATVLAWASDGQAAEPVVADPKGPPLLVAGQYGDGNRGRVLALAAFDTYLWERLGQPKTRQGVEIHNRFWKQCVLWLAHQEEDEGAVYARPKVRRIAVGRQQTVEVGLRDGGGNVVKDARIEAKVIGPGEDEAAAKVRPVVANADGSARVLYEPDRPGEYTVLVRAEGKDAKGADLKGEARARFLAFPDVSDEMLKTATDHEFLKRLSAATGEKAKALRLEDLPSFLKELKSQPLDTVKPKPRYIPDWRRDHSKGFLPGWLVLFVALLGVEWALRRLWGMV